MRYLGSKTLVAEQVLDLISPAPGDTFCDPFGGIATISASAKRRGCKVTTADILACPHAFQVARIVNSRLPAFRGLRERYGFETREEIIERLRSATVDEGWLVEEFSTKRMFFTPANARLIEGARRLIADWAAEAVLSPSERAVLLASLVNSMDRVANTAGTYYAHLKSLSRKARRPFSFELIRPSPGLAGCRAYLDCAENVVTREPWDVLYLDPPYNGRSYAAYYHLPESICRLETPPSTARSGVPSSVQRPASDFNRPARALAALKSVLANARSKRVAFHYSRNGLIPLNDARRLLQSFGRIDQFALAAPGYTTRNEPRKTEHILLIASRA